MSFWITFFSLFLLFLTQHFMTRGLSHLVHHLGGSRRTVIWIWSIIFLPGTILHELSHFLLATFVGLRTGKIQILPEFLDEELDNKHKSHSVTLGFVQVRQANPLQGFFVGVAPFITGTIAIVWLVSLIQTSLSNQSVPLLLLQSYLFFTIANSFFPSWSDIKQTLPLIIILAVFALILWYFKVEINLSSQSRLFTLLDLLNTALLISVIANISILCVLTVLNYLFKPKRRIY